MLAHLLNWISLMLENRGWAQPSIGAVSDHLGWILSHNGHWLIRICRVGTSGCHF